MVLVKLEDSRGARTRACCRCVHHILLKRVVPSTPNPVCGDFSYILYDTLYTTLLIYDTPFLYTTLPDPPPPPSPAPRSRPKHCLCHVVHSKESTRLDRSTPLTRSKSLSEDHRPRPARENRPESRLGLGLWTKSQSTSALCPERVQSGLYNLVRVPLI